jgi:hypothetical protein
MLSRDTRDLKLLCDLTAAALPELELASARISPETLLHVRVPAALEPGAPDGSTAAAVGEALYGCVLRRHQGAGASACPEPGFAPDVRFDRIRVHADARYHRLSENRQDASVASPGKRLPTATPGTG